MPSENPQADGREDESLPYGTTGRMVWRGPVRSGRPGFAFLMPLSLPSAYGAWAFDGYDPIIAGRPETLSMQARLENEPLAAARAYGVRWILVANPEYYRPERDYWQAVRKNDWCFDYMDDGATSAVERLLPAARVRVQREEVCLYELPETSPMAFDRSEPGISLPVRFHGWGAAVDAPSGAKRTIIVNMAMRPWVRAAANGVVLPTSADDWGRVAVELPNGATRFDVYYELPWRRGVLLGIGFAAATLLGFGFVNGRRNRANGRVPTAVLRRSLF